MDFYYRLFWAGFKGRVSSKYVVFQQQQVEGTLAIWQLNF